MQVLKNTIQSSKAVGRFVARRSNNNNNSIINNSNDNSKKLLSTVAAQKVGQKHAVDQRSTTGLFVATSAFVLLWSTSLKPNIAYNHCQVPCGIFDDPAIVDEMRQACATIRKAIVQSKTLHGKVTADPLSMNQMVRWINTKEEHCNKVIALISDYCLCQRVKRINFQTENEYLQALKVHHVTMQAAMKAKQSMDEKSCDDLEHAVSDLAKMYTK